MATSAPEDEGPPLDAEAMGKFEAMFADLLVEVKEGRLSQEEAIQAATRRMEAHRDAIQASPHCSAAARRLLSVETDECVAVLLKDGLSTGGDPARIPDISEATLAALNAVLSGKPSSPEQRAKWPRGLGDVLDADPVVTAKVLRGPRTRRALGVRPRRGPAPAGAAERVDQPHGPAHQGRHRVQDQVPTWRVQLHVRGGVDAIAASVVLSMRVLTPLPLPALPLLRPREAPLGTHCRRSWLLPRDVGEGARVAARALALLAKLEALLYRSL